MVAASISLYYLIPYKTQTEIRPPFRLTLLLKYSKSAPLKRGGRKSKRRKKSST